MFPFLACLGALSLIAALVAIAALLRQLGLGSAGLVISGFVLIGAGMAAIGWLVSA